MLPYRHEPIRAAVEVAEINNGHSAASILHHFGGWGGPERVIDIVDERAPDGFSDLDAVISRQEMEEILGDYKRAAGSDRELLNNRPSLSVR